MALSKKVTIVVSNILLMIAAGTAIYHEFEGWDWVDSFYFTCTTLMTIGFGDLHPTMTITKLFTVFFAFGGIGLMLYSLTVIGEEYFSKRSWIEPRKIMEKTIRTIAKDVVKKEEEVFKYEMKKFFERKKRQRYNYRPKTKSKKKLKAVKVY